MASCTEAGETEKSEIITFTKLHSLFEVKLGSVFRKSALTTGTLKHKTTPRKVDASTTIHSALLLHISKLLLPTPVGISIISAALLGLRVKDFLKFLQFS